MPFGIDANGTVLTIGSASLDLVSIAIPGAEVVALDTSTLSNTAWITKVAGSLKDVPDVSGTVNFDPTDYTKIVAEIGTTQAITFNFASPYSTLTIYGFLASFTVNEGSNNEVWTASITITVTNDNGGVETGPAYS